GAGSREPRLQPRNNERYFSWDVRSNGACQRVPCCASPSRSHRAKILQNHTPRSLLRSRRCYAIKRVARAPWDTVATSALVCSENPPVQLHCPQKILPPRRNKTTSVGFHESCLPPRLSCRLPS